LLVGPPALLGELAVEFDVVQELRPVRADDAQLTPPDVEPDAQPRADPRLDVRDPLEPAVGADPPLDVGRELGVDDVVLLGPVPLVERPLVLHLLLAVARRPDLKDDLREDAALLPDLVAAAVALRPAERHVHVRGHP